MEAMWEAAVKKKKKKKNVMFFCLLSCIYVCVCVEISCPQFFSLQASKKNNKMDRNVCVCVCVCVCVRECLVRQREQ